MADSLAFMWTGDAFVPAARFIAAAGEKFSLGATYWMSVEPERSDKTHNHEFAFVGEAWKNLPEDIAATYPNPDALRRRALIATGWCTVRDYVCTSQAEAKRLCRTLEAELDEYAIAILQGDVVRVCRARSQARSKMKGPEFQKCKTDVLNWISELLGVTPEALSQARAA